MGPVTTTITHSGGTVTPDAVSGYDPAFEVRTIVHTILGRVDPDITFRPAALRSGSLPLEFASQADVWAAVAVLRVPQVLSLSNSDIPVMDMAFVVAPGALRPELDSTRTRWTLTVPYQEVLL